MKIILNLFFFTAIISKPSKHFLKERKLEEGPPDLFDQTPQRQQMIKMQTRYHYDEDLTDELVNRNRRKYLADSIGQLVDELTRSFDSVKTNFNSKMEKIQSIVNERPEAIENEIDRPTEEDEVDKGLI